MGVRRFWLLLAVLCAGSVHSVWADETTGPPEDIPASTANKTGREAPGKGSFTPYWSGETGYTYTNQPSHLGPVEVTQEVRLTGNYNLSEGGHFLSFSAGGGQQILEGATTSYGSFNVSGGLGFGFFQPSLEVAFQQGAQAMNTTDPTLTLNFQVLKPLTLGLTLGGELESHQGPQSIVSGASDRVVEVDSYSWTAGGTALFAPWDFLSFSLMAELERSYTYQWQNILHTSSTHLGQTEDIPSATAGLDLTFLPGLTLNLSLQEGVEYFPAGTGYSPILKKTVQFSKATSESFAGYSFGFSYGL